MELTISKKDWLIMTYIPIMEDGLSQVELDRVECLFSIPWSSLMILIS